MGKLVSSSIQQIHCISACNNDLVPVREVNFPNYVLLVKFPVYLKHMEDRWLINYRLSPREGTLWIRGGHTFPIRGQGVKTFRFGGHTVHDRRTLPPKRLPGSCTVVFPASLKAGALTSHPQWISSIQHIRPTAGASRAFYVLVQDVKAVTYTRGNMVLADWLNFIFS